MTAYVNISLKYTSDLEWLGVTWCGKFSLLILFKGKKLRDIEIFIERKYKIEEQERAWN